MVEDQDQSPDLRALREAQKLDLATLSSATSLSVAQLRELEEGGSGHFYSDTIKQQALRRVLRHLGVATEPMAANSSLGTPAPDGSGQQNQGVIQGIIRLSQAGDQFEDPRFPTTRQMEMPGWVGWLAVLLGLVIVLVWTYPYEEVDEFWTGLKERFSSPTTQTVSVQPTASPALATASDDKPGEANAAAPAAAGKEASVTVTEVTPWQFRPHPPPRRLLLCQHLRLPLLQHLSPHPWWPRLPRIYPRPVKTSNQSPCRLHPSPSTSQPNTST